MVQARIPSIEAIPPGVPGLMWMGREAVRRGDAEEAVAWFRTVLAAEPDNVHAALATGACLAHVERHEAAYDVLQRAVAAGTEDAVVWLEFARAAARTGRHDQAFRVMGSMCAGSPDIADLIAEDPAFEAFSDHPWFLSIVGGI